MDDLFKAPNNLMDMLFTLSLESEGNVFPSFDKPVNSCQWHFFLLPFIPLQKEFLLCVCPNQHACHSTLRQNDIEKVEWPVIRCTFYACRFERL